jgi:hypothetical protein
MVANRPKHRFPITLQVFSYAMQHLVALAFLITLPLFAQSQATDAAADNSYAKWLVGVRYSLGVSGFVGPGTLNFENQTHPMQGGVHGTFRFHKHLGVGLEVNMLNQGGRSNAYSTILVEGVNHQQIIETNYKLHYLQVPLHAVVLLDEYKFRLRFWAGPYFASMLSKEAEQVTILKTLVAGSGQNSSSSTAIEIKDDEVESTEMGLSLGGSMDIPVYARKLWAGADLRYVRGLTQFNVNDKDIPAFENQPRYHNSTLQMGLSLYWQF